MKDLNTTGDGPNKGRKTPSKSGKEILNILKPEFPRSGKRLKVSDDAGGYVSITSGEVKPVDNNASANSSVCPLGLSKLVLKPSK